MKAQRNRAFLKWAGGKYRVLDHILPHLGNADTLIEPFFGAGSVALNSSFQQFILNDVNSDLINLYQNVQQDPEGFIQAASHFFNEASNQQAFYYECRDEFNQSSDPLRKACLFLYMNRHGYNGLCRYNRSGGFNVPFGRYLKPKFPEHEIRAFSQKFKQASFTNQDFSALINNAQPNAVVYCDPPYLPISKTADFTQYASTSFPLEQQERLAQLARQAAQNKGVKVIISNHDTPLSRELYAGARIHSFPVKRFISQNPNTRKPVQELLAIF